MKDTRITNRARTLLLALSIAMMLIGAGKTYAEIHYTDSRCNSRAHTKYKQAWGPWTRGFEKYTGSYGFSIDAIELGTEPRTYYQVHYKGGRWLPTVSSQDNDYAGIIGKPIDAISISATHLYLNGGTYISYDDVLIDYMVHLTGSSGWLPPVTGSNINDSRNGYAGILGRQIDGFRLFLWVGYDDGIYD